MSEQSCRHVAYCTSNLCPVRDRYSYNCSRLKRFLDGLVDLKRDLNIRPGNGTDRDRRRLAVAVADYFVRFDFNKNIDRDWLIEAEVYQNAAGLVCDPIPEEIRLSDLPPAKRWPADPLALYPTGGAEYPAGRFTKMILACLRYRDKKELEDGGQMHLPRRIENRKPAHLRLSRPVAEGHKRHAGLLAEEVRPPLRPARGEGVLSRG